MDYITDSDMSEWFEYIEYLNILRKACNNIVEVTLSGGVLINALVNVLIIALIF